jgi:hypothetical protein
MNISLEEQIEYMRGEIKYWTGMSYDARHWTSLRANNKVHHCEAILATLEATRDTIAAFDEIQRKEGRFNSEGKALLQNEIPKSG